MITVRWKEAEAWPKQKIEMCEKEENFNNIQCEYKENWSKAFNHY